MILRASLPFAAFVVWLLSVPMDGFLLPGGGVEDALLCFLVPHLLALILIGTTIERSMLSPLASMGGFFSMISTILMNHSPVGLRWFLAMAGVGSAFVCVKSCTVLKRSPGKELSAALGLAAANVLLFLFMVVPLSDGVKLHAAASLLLVPVLARGWDGDENGGEERLSPFLPFVFVFQMVSGLMYGSIYGDYGRAALLPGIEVIFYVAATGAGIALVIRRRREVLLVLGILSAMFAFSLFLLQGPLPVNGSLFAMQTAAGFIDLYLLVLLLDQRDTLRALGIGLAVTCAGIAAGKGISMLIGVASNLVAGVANLLLTASVLVLYLLIRGGRHMDQQVTPAVLMAGTIETKDEEPGSQPELMLPPGMRRRFSEQEKSVLACIVRGMTFRETARELAISESSVKTYMKRIYEKMSVSGKEELLSKLRDE